MYVCMHIMDGRSEGREEEDGANLEHGEEGEAEVAYKQTVPQNREDDASPRRARVRDESYGTREAMHHAPDSPSEQGDASPRRAHVRYARGSTIDWR